MFVVVDEKLNILRKTGLLRFPEPAVEDGVDLLEDFQDFGA